MNNKSRELGIDTIKVIAVMLVITVHFFLNTEFYNTPRYGLSMHFQYVVRNFCMICVPLFIITTGYLNKEKSYSKSFFKKLLNILIVWLFYSTIEFFVLKGFLHDFSGLSIKKFLYSLFSFEACGYSWYIAMYMGLYFISPVINTAMESFDKKIEL